MPAFEFSEAEQNGLHAYLASLKQSVEISALRPFIRAIPFGDQAAIRRGQVAFEGLYKCGQCHVYQGKGGATANDLTDIRQKLQPEWTQKYLLDPARFDPGSSMPPLFVVEDGQGQYEHVHLDRDAGGDLADILAYMYQGQRAEERPAPQNVTLGKEVFQAMRCAHCHQQKAPTPFAPALESISQRFTGSYLRQYLERPVPRRPFGSIVGQGGRMPNFGLSTDEVERIASELEAMKAPLAKTAAAPALTPFQRKKATRLLKEKSPCLGCHAWGDDGGRVAPQLMGVGGRLNHDYINGIIDHPAQVVPHAVMPKVKGRPTPRTNRLIKALLTESQSDEGSAGVYLDLDTHRRLTPPSNGADMGAALYAKNCAMCHGDQGRGDGFNARYLNPPPTDLTNAVHMSTRTDDTLYDVLHVGGFLLDKSHRMPPWGERLTHDELRALVTHIRTLCQCEQPSWAGDGR